MSYQTLMIRLGKQPLWMDCAPGQDRPLRGIVKTHVPVMPTLDRYVIRELIGPFALALGLFTFVLAIRPVLDSAEVLLAKGVPVPTVGFLLLTLLPQALGITLPMAFLAGMLMTFGRLSGDRETVALLACGISPLRLLRPVLVVATVAAALTLYVMVELVPNSNQKFREVTALFTAQTAESDIKPRMFYEGFPQKVIYVQAVRPSGGWDGVMLADTSQPGTISVALAEHGRLVLDKTAQLVNIVLEQVAQYVPGSEPAVYNMSQASSTVFQVDPQTIFGDPSSGLKRGFPEMTIADLQRERYQKVATADAIRARLAHGGLPPKEVADLTAQLKGQSPHNEIMFIHQKFSFPVACLVFALLALAFGFHTRKEGKLAGLTLGLAGITIYYALMEIAEAGAKAPTHWFSPVWARWFPNLVLGATGLVAVWWRARATGHSLSFQLPEWMLRPFKAGSAGDLRATGTTTQRRSRVVVVVRIPRLSFPRPRLLDLYVGRQYLRMVALAFVGLLVLYYVGTIVDLSEKLFKGQGDTKMLMQYLWYSTPKFVSFVIPAATLVAVLGTIGGLTRSSELTVMRACGVSLYRAALPLVVLALIWAGILFALEERVMPGANKSAEELEDTIRDRPHHTVNIANRNWLAGKGGRIYYYAVFDPGRGGAPLRLHTLSVFETAARPYRLLRQTFAKSAVCPDRACLNGVWEAEDGWVQEFVSPTRTTRSLFAARRVNLSPAKEFTLAQLDTSMMTFNELRDYIRRSRISGFSVAEQEVNLHGKIAFPAVTLVMTFLAIPFAVTTGRRGALYGIGLAIVLSVAYWLSIAFFVAAGSAGVLPAPLAAWATNILFSALAVYMVLTVRT